MINILYALNGIFHNGGTEAVVLNYFNNINKEKFHIDFLLHGSESENLDNETHNYLKSQGSRIYYVTPRGKNFLKNKKEIRNILKDNSYDIVHSHMDAAGSFFLKEAKDLGIKVRVAHSHNTDNQINKGNLFKNKIYTIILNYAKKSIKNYANVFLACSDAAGKWLFGNTPFIVINNGIDIAKYSYKDGVRLEQRKKYSVDDKIVIGHVGRFCYQKNQEFIIKIFYELSKDIEDICLILIGDGESKKDIELMINNLKIKEKVILLGSISNVNEVLQAFDVFVLPSNFEGLGIVAIEAQTAGLPCVISDSVPQEVEITEAVKFLSLTDSAECWCKEIIGLLTNYKRKDNSEKIKKAGYDINDVVEIVEDIYLESINRVN
ncbi:MAG: glycosyltransferase family 1 protein [Oscillospiraceae bacterium]